MPYVLRWQAALDEQPTPQFDGMALSLTRHLIVACDITIVVQSYSPTTKRRVSAQYLAEHMKETIKPGQAQPRRQIYRWVQNYGLARLHAIAATGWVTFARFTPSHSALIPIDTPLETEALSFCLNKNYSVCPISRKGMALMNILTELYGFKNDFCRVFETALNKN